MKKILTFSTIAICLLTSTLYGNDTVVCKGKPLQKVISKNFIVSPNTIISLDNRYGDIVIVEGQGNEVHCEITIKAEASNESKAQKTLDRISIDFHNSASELLVKTNIEESSSWFNWSFGNESMEINYKITMPTSQTLNIDHAYGDVLLPNYFGTLNIDLSYGSLNAADINNASILDISYSEVKIGCAKSVTSNVKYSEFSMNSSDNITIDSKYSDLVIGHSKKATITSKYSEFKYETLENLTFNGGYDHMTINEVGSVTFKNNYGELSITRLLGNASVNANYTDISLKGLGPKCNSVDIVGDYSDISIQNTLGYQYSLVGKYIDSNVENDDEDDNNTNIRGQKGSGKTNVQINGNYIDVTLK